MAAVAVTVEATLEQDFRLACLDLAAARDDQRRKDTPPARARVARCRAEVDRVLDLRNAVRAHAAAH
jgi:hypothetical protein